ncbi:MAG: hypothetical protein ACSLFN_15380 [Candidatus Limnocylindrales bacterium]
MTGSSTASTFTAGDRVHRHAALLRPFMQIGSKVELRAVWARIRSLGLADEAVAARITQAFERADRLSMGLQVDGRDITARDVYDAYANGKYFGDDPEAKAILESMSWGPMSAFVEMLFHEACGSYTSLVFDLLPIVREAEGAGRGTGEDEEAPAATCIYCRTTAGDFGPEEHVIPESLVGDGLVIKGMVCGDCNNRLSALDQALIDFEPLALLRTMYLPLTKKGKFPRATLGDITIEKTAPRHLRMTVGQDRPPTDFDRQPDGTVRFQEHFEMRNRDPIVLARALFKIGLGLVAHDAGADVALDSRYDAARAFILNGKPIATHLLMPTTSKPSPVVRTWWQPFDGATAVILDLFGLIFAFGLEPAPLELPPGLPRESVLIFWLGPEGHDPLASASTQQGA